MARMLRDGADFAPARWTSLTALFTGGAPNPAADIRWWLEQGVRMVDGYRDDRGRHRARHADRSRCDRPQGRFGGPARAVAVAAHRRRRRTRRRGRDEPGEIWLSGPNITPGYWNRPEETARAFTADGWFRTGDIARQDDDGFVTLVDRRKDMFISGGENVFPVEVEMVLLDHPDVAEAAVIGVADERWGEVGRAFVVVKPGRALEPAALASHCAARIARYKVPKEFLRDRRCRAPHPARSRSIYCVPAASVANRKFASRILLELRAGGLADFASPWMSAQQG